jgi:hypothetical protein
MVLRHETSRQEGVLRFAQSPDGDSISSCNQKTATAEA